MSRFIRPARRTNIKELSAVPLFREHVICFSVTVVHLGAADSLNTWLKD
jgi:hypothetical protein